nr:MAG TPA: Mitochondrial division protein 1 [Caudoviricetes sp.]
MHSYPANDPAAILQQMCGNRLLFQGFRANM